MKKLMMLVILILVLSLLSGCWSRRELNELAIVTALGIDKMEDEYLVTVQILNPGEIAGQAQTTRVAVSSYRTKGRSLFEAVRKLTMETPRKSYLTHLRVVVFGEALAQEGITKALDFLSRDHEVRTDFYIAVAKDQKATDILNVLTAVDKIPANKVFNSIETSEKAWAPTKGVHLDDLISKIISEGSSPVLTGVYYQGDSDIGNDLKNVEKVDSPTSIIVDYLAIFKDDKLVGWLNMDESKGYNYLDDNVTSTVAIIPCEQNDGNITLEVINSKTNTKATIDNGTPTIHVTTKTEANIGEVQCNIDVMKEEEITKMEKTFEKLLKELIEQAIEKAKEKKTDIFGFGEAIHRADPKVWKELKKNWHDEGFVELDVVIKTNVKIRRLGTITESFQK